jgi:hypothetical protein
VQKSRREYHSSGLYTLKGAVNLLGGRVIDKRYRAGKALANWRAGGDVSVQQETIIDLAVKSKLILDSIDVWLLSQPSLVNPRKRSLLHCSATQGGRDFGKLWAMSSEPWRPVVRDRFTAVLP